MDTKIKREEHFKPAGGIPTILRLMQLPDGNFKVAMLSGRGTKMETRMTFQCTSEAVASRHFDYLKRALLRKEGSQ